MLRRSPTLARTATICLMILLCLCQLTSAQDVADVDLPHMGNETQPELVCRPFGICEPCPEDSLEEPFCQPFGNRRLMHCVNITSFPQPTAIRPGGAPPPRPQPPDTSNSLERPSHGETPAWESCGRIVSQEHADFWEFVACNILFAVISLFVLFARSRRLQALQARQLAARIGLIRGGGTQTRR